MAEQWSEEFAKDVRQWSNKVAGLAADALVDRKLITKEQFPRAEEIIAEEVLARLSLLDYPPVPNELREGSST